MHPYAISQEPLHIERPNLACGMVLGQGRRLTASLSDRCTSARAVHVQLLEPVHYVPRRYISATNRLRASKFGMWHVH